ncbi:flagellar filament capping protein FliD [Sphingomonas baiyangensis]|uniref:Flagellar hook-associated protein 2 n=1 Tax=Sphingomonas baiyangensis TaxID=2572576 RepID=A0A4U1L6P3_9SPHN|nr:flagellar filament capping protein FliD [Sphingomonas baiyangensis]TKD52013.1 flagellar hook protein [Sphingomonas baiyangensis]
MTIESIAKTLGTGSGIDIGALVTSLVDAQFANRTERLDTRSETLTAQISSASELKNAISGFSAALASLTRSGTLTTQPTSSKPDILGVSVQPGSTARASAADIEVRQIATAQTVHSRLETRGSAATVGTGTLTFTFGKAEIEDGAFTGFTPGAGEAVTVEIGTADATLDGIAAKINAAGISVRASVLSDGNGARLVLKGATGESQAFEMNVAETGTPGLAALAVGRTGTQSTVSTAAGDALLRVDGVDLQRASNTINNIVPGVRLDLVTAQPGTVVRIGTTAPVTALGQAVEDVVATYNELRAMLAEATDPVTGPLRSDNAARNLSDQLRRLAAQPLVANAAPGVPNTLAELGVATNRDGTLSVDAVRLTRVLTEQPQAVEAIFASGGGLTTALASIATAATSRSTGLGASEARYTDQQMDVADERAKALESAEALRVRMTQQFASMDAKVAVYKSTQTFLEQQVDAWNAQR